MAVLFLGRTEAGITILLKTGAGASGRLAGEPSL
jgi:hypothetical protein